MSVTYTEAQAFEAGVWAAERGAPLGDCPLYGPTEACRLLRMAWTRGHKSISQPAEPAPKPPAKRARKKAR